MKLSITVTGSDAVQQALRDIGRQAPYALAAGLNALANDVQREIQHTLGARFTLRREAFVKRTIYRDKATDFATKTHPRATVRVNPARDVLTAHEEGGRKAPRTGRHLAIPLPAVQPNPTQVIPKRLRPSALRTSDQVRKITTPSGTFLVRNRPGRGKGGLIGWRTEFLYRLRPDVPLRPRLGFLATAERIINASWDRHLMAGIDKALRTAR